MRQCFRVGQIVHRDEVEIAYAVVLRCANYLAPNASEPIDAYPCCHSTYSSWLKPVATRVGTAESHVADYPRAGIVKHLGAGVESCCRRYHVIDNYYVRA